MDFPPGSEFRYNNTGYMLLGMLLEQVTKLPYAALMERDFFKPLGMRSAAYCPSKPTDPNYATGYAHEGESWRVAEYLSMTHPYAAGAICMSVPDYLRWQSALHRGRIVNARSLALMTGPETLTAGARKGTKTGYGMGLATMDLDKHMAVQHGGGINGFSTQQYWFPADSLSIVAFLSTQGGQEEFLVNNLASATFGLPTRPRLARSERCCVISYVSYRGSHERGLQESHRQPHP